LSAWYNPTVAPDVDTARIPIAVTSDGKPGHENQSLGIAEHIPAADVLLFRHNLGESLSEAIFRMRVRFGRLNKAVARGLLEEVFSGDDLDRLVKHQPRAVIAAGTLSAAPCILAGALTGAKTCICMKPSFLPLSMFDLAVVPAHDNPPDDPRILKTLAAPNRVSPERLSDEADRWWDELPPGEKVISWVIGGPSASATFDELHVLGGLLETLVWARNNGWQVWLSTARRTPESLENGIAEIARGYPALTWMLLWHRDRRNPLYAMFFRSRLAIVTSDSVSMIAEAASAGKGPLVFQASGTPGSSRTKQDRMVDGLIDAGYGSRASTPEALIDLLDNAIKSDIQFPILDDTRKAAERLLQVIEVR
jgi:mitochondrial fission protein ELM1